jgi:catechol 2,3-dioxygenase-like lactoylglutathione lyase family enzyme
MSSARPSTAAAQAMSTGHVHGFDHVQLAMPVGGEGLARRFYGELLGLVEIPKPATLASRGGAWFECGPIQLHLGVEGEFRPAKKAHPAFLVQRLAVLIGVLETAGYEVKIEPGPTIGVDRAFTADPFGNRIELVERHTTGEQTR